MTEYGVKNRDLIDKWLDFKLIDQGKSKTTVSKYRVNLEKFIDYLESSKLSVLSVTRDNLKEFCGMHLFKLGLSPRTRTTFVSAVKGLFKWLYAEGIRSDNPGYDLVHPEYGKRLPRVMQLDHAKKLIKVPDMNTFMGVRDAAILGVLMGCGLRVSGVSGLNRSSLIFQDMDNGYESLFLRVIEKGDKERIAPAPAETMLLMRAYLGHPELSDYDRSINNDDQVLFVATNRNIPPCDFHGEATRLGVGGIFRMIKRHGEACGLPGDVLHPHALRHMFGMELAESDVDIKEIQLLMGHAHISTTTIYLHLAMRKLAKKVQDSSPISKIDTPVTPFLNDLKSKKRK